jgi:hypothetical protein
MWRRRVLVSAHALRRRVRRTAFRLIYGGEHDQIACRIDLPDLLEPGFAEPCKMLVRCKPVRLALCYVIHFIGYQNRAAVFEQQT